MKLLSLEEFKVNRKDLHNLWNNMSREELLEEIWKESLDVIKNLIREKQQFDLSKFCKNILDEEYSGVERTLENITHDLKNEII